MMAKGGQEVGDVVVVKPVVSPTTLPPHVDKASLAKKPELMGRAALSHAGKLGELIDGSLSIEHCPEQLQAAARCEEPHRIGELIRLGIVERSFRRGVFRGASHGANATASRIDFGTLVA